MQTLVHFPHLDLRTQSVTARLTLAAQVWPQAKAAVVVPAISPTAKVCSLVMGISVTLILFCSHFHQVVDDKAAGKMSPIVKMGTANGVKVKLPSGGRGQRGSFHQGGGGEGEASIRGAGAKGRGVYCML